MITRRDFLATGAVATPLLASSSTTPIVAIDKEGYMHAPSAPGLGIEWDKKFFQKYKLETG